MNKPINASDASAPGLADLLRVSFEQLGYQQLSNIECEVDGDVAPGEMWHLGTPTIGSHLT